MAVQTRKETIYEERTATAALSDKVHDLVQTLSEKLDSVWRYDTYIEDCEGDQRCISMFEKMRDDDVRHVEMLRTEIERLCKDGSFR